MTTNNIPEGEYMCRFEKNDDLDLLSIDGGRGASNRFYKIRYAIGEGVRNGYKDTRKSHGVGRSF